MSVFACGYSSRASSSRYRGSIAYGDPNDTRPTLSGCRYTDMSDTTGSLGGGSHGTSRPTKQRPMNTPDRVGVQRSTMRENPLLIPTKVGAVKKASYALPDLQFSYGKKTISDDGGTAAAIGHWNYGNATRKSMEPARMPRDFIKLNKAAANAGLRNAKEVYQFSAIHDFRKTEQHGRRRASDTYPPPGMTFGKQTRASTPLWDVLGNRYQRDWIQDRYDASEVSPDIEVKPSYGQVYETHASLVRRHVEPPDPRPPWKMAKFERVPAHLKTFRSSRAREDAVAAHDLDKVARTGTIGHGVYATAQS
ncbi:cilia- and flagella-associated protein 77-like isoform X1 [Sycon ciliatum]|uniref:cilia- and flagella-associated protein 77-like isoform X1 n=2 Tax=Sycon ciliatum TaxID=27933 RepID=UPI0031F6A065